MKMELWKNGEDVYLIHSRDIQKKVMLPDRMVFLITGIDPTNLDMNHLQELFNQYGDNHENTHLSDEEYLEDFLHSIGYIDTYIELASETEDVRDVLAFDCEDQFFYRLNETEAISSYEVNTKEGIVELVAADITEIIQLEVKNDYIETDKWNVKDIERMKRYNCAGLYPIVSLNGQLVDKLFLLKEWSDNKYTHDTGRIITADEVKYYISMLNKVINAYKKAEKDADK